jgi:chromosome segregation ATPase
VDVTAADDPRDGHGDWRPVPDPTALTTQQLRRELSGLREVLTARLDGMDRATELLSETVNRTPTVIQTEISHLRELMDEQFKSIALQFSERDVRTNQAATASAQALAAALQAAKEAVFEQAQAAAKAADKTETSTSKQIDLLLSQIKAQGETFSDRLAELKERIDRGEGSSTGASDYRNERRLDTGQLVQFIGLLVAVGVALFAVVHG